MNDSEIVNLFAPDILKSCPWCGGKAIIKRRCVSVQNGESFRLDLMLKCSNCGAVPPNGFFDVSFEHIDYNIIIGLNDLNKAINNWNRRDENGQQ